MPVSKAMKREIISVIARAGGPHLVSRLHFSGDASRDPLRTINTVGVKHNTTPKETLCRHSIVTRAP